MRSSWRARVAHWYAENLGPVFPCSPDNKRPLVARGFKSATRNHDQIETWWRHWPNALIGLATGFPSRLVVVDLDVKGGKDGPAELLKRGWLLGRTWVARTRSGGWHAYFRHPGYAIRCSAGWPAEGVDLRADGGYVIVPGPRDGYRWAALRPGRVPLAPMPIWLVQALRERDKPVILPVVRCTWRSDPGALTVACDRIAGAAPGSRQTTLAQQAFRAGRLVREGRADAAEARAAIRAAAAAINPGDGWSPRQALRDAERCFDAGCK